MEASHDEMTSLVDKGSTLDTLYPDLSKAFHHGLPQYCYIQTGKMWTVSWVENWLDHWAQKFVINITAGSKFGMLMSVLVVWKLRSNMLSLSLQMIPNWGKVTNMLETVAGIKGVWLG